MIKILDGDVVYADADIIAHQVNCRGTMGAGLAKQIKFFFPEAFNAYESLCKQHRYDPDELLGNCQLVMSTKPNDDRVIIANLFAQDRYGRDRRFTDYDAFRQCMVALNRKAKSIYAKTIALPYKIGCGLAGGDWDKIYNIIENELAGFDVKLYRIK